MKLVLQCAMCGTHHPVGTVVCSTCRATGVAQLRLMFECQSCGRLDISPWCEACPAVVEPLIVLDLDEGLIMAEEISVELAPTSDDVPEALPFELDDEDEMVAGPS